MFHAGPDHPLAGGGDRPDFAALGLQVEYQRLHVRENPLGDFFLEERDRGAHHFGFRHATIHGHHFGAHVVFADFAGHVLGIAAASPADNLIRKQATAQLPFEEARAGVARPESSVAIKNRELRLKLRTDFRNSAVLRGEFGSRFPDLSACREFISSAGYAALRSPRGCSHSW